MKHLIGLLLACACIASAADKNSAITGVWRGEIEGFPGLVMTISGEGKELAGAILFYLLRRDEGKPPSISAGTPEPMLNLGLDGNTLSFQVSHRRAHGAQTVNDPPVNFRLTITKEGQGWLIRGKDEVNAIQLVRDK